MNLASCVALSQTRLQWMVHPVTWTKIFQQLMCPDCRYYGIRSENTDVTTICFGKGLWEHLNAWTTINASHIVQTEGFVTFCYFPSILGICCSCVNGNSWRHMLFGVNTWFVQILGRCVGAALEDWMLQTQNPLFTFWRFIYWKHLQS